jgi:hypothetical protein
MTAGGNQFQKVQPGQRRILPAAVWNAMLETVEYVQALRESGGALIGASAAPVCVKPVKNTSGQDVARFEVLGIDDILFYPYDDQDEFCARPALKGVVPRLPDHAGKFCVLAEPAASDDMALAVLSGVVPVKVQVDSNQSWYGYADVSTVKEHLILQPYGPAQVLWKESGTGEKWALVRLGNPGGMLSSWGKLDAVLSPNSSAPVSLWWNGSDTGFDVTAYDWLLASGTTLPAQTKVKVEWFPQERVWWITAAECS